MWVLIRGGLGNQMFQAAFAIAIEKRFGVIPRYIDVTKKARTKREWGLSCFDIEPSSNSMLMLPVLSWLVQGTRVLKRLRILGGSQILIEQIDSVGRPKLVSAPKLLSGYWQGESFFSEVEETIRKRFKFPAISNVAPICTDTSRPTVAIHVRRGDYVNDSSASNKHLVCDADWYQQAWNELQRRVGSLNTIVFSDDPTWARAELALGTHVYYVDDDKNNPAWVDMARMAQCDHFVISNSSYSWWAAYLGTSPNKQVIAPKWWFQWRETETLGICPPSWILL